jgi:hypothetical protein
MNFHTAMSKGIVPKSSASNRATTALPPDVTTTILPDCVKVARMIDVDLTVAGRIAAVKVLQDIHGVPLAAA